MDDVAPVSRDVGVMEGGAHGDRAVGSGPEGDRDRPHPRIGECDGSSCPPAPAPAGAAGRGRGMGGMEATMALKTRKTSRGPVLPGDEAAAVPGRNGLLRPASRQGVLAAHRDVPRHGSHLATEDRFDPRRLRRVVGLLGQLDDELVMDVGDDPITGARIKA